MTLSVMTSSFFREDESEVVTQLKEELLRKERKLTDIRLEALTSQHQLHQMQDAMHRMRVRHFRGFQLISLTFLNK